MNIVTIDVGSKNTAFAWWSSSVLIDFTLCPMTSLEQILQQLGILKQYFENKSHVYIENQMSCNRIATKIQIQIEMWVKINYPNIIFKLFPAKNKYLTLDKSIYNTKTKRKKWASSFVMAYLPKNLIDRYKILKKKDDIADAVIIGLVVLNLISK